MKNYNIKDLKLMDMPRKNGIFDCESEVSIEDKIAFVDRFQDGKLSYIISIAEKFVAEQDTLKKDASGDIKTVSKQAWLRRNDTRGIIGRTVSEWWDNCGAFQMLGLRGNSIRANVFHFPSQSSIHELVDDCFHVQLEDCLLEEKRYYNEHNGEQKLIKGVCRTLSRYGYPYEHHFSIGGDNFIVAKRSYPTDEYSIEVCLPKEDRYLTLEEVKKLEDVLAPVEEKYQQLLKAQEEMKNALSKVGSDFAAYLSTKGESA